MARYCSRCNEHIDLHGHKRIVGSRGGMARSCRPQALSAAAAAVNVNESTSALYSAAALTPEAKPATSCDSSSVAPHHLLSSVASSAPYGNDFTALNESCDGLEVDHSNTSSAYVRVRKAGAAAPTGHMAGSSCEVVHDPQADDFIPIHISGRGQYSVPRGNLVGAGVQSQYNELAALVQPNTSTSRFGQGIAHRSSLAGGSLLPK